MTEESETTASPADTPVTALKGLKERLAASFKALGEDCNQIQRAQEAGAKKNVLELKEKWVNRCCG